MLYGSLLQLAYKGVKAMNFYAKDMNPIFDKIVGYDRANNNFSGGGYTVSQPPSNYPPYNILSVGENDYIIEIALAGFSKENIEVTVKNNILVVKGPALESVEDGDDEGSSNIGLWVFGILLGLGIIAFIVCFIFFRKEDNDERGLENKNE